MKYFSLAIEKLKKMGAYLKKVDDKEPVHTFYYLAGSGFLLCFFLFLSQSYLLANVLSVAYFVVYIGFYVAYNGKGMNKKKVCFKALILDIVISVVVLQLLFIAT